MWGRGRGTKVRTRTCLGMSLCFLLNRTIQCKKHVSKHAGLPTCTTHTFMCTTTHHTLTHYMKIDSPAVDQDLDRCICVCLRVRLGNSKPNIFIQKPLFVYSASSGGQLMHALLIIYTVKLDQCCMHVNRGVSLCVHIQRFSHLLYVYVCVGG